ncbi:MAG: hypothetical protein ACLQJR_06840, partial [Stellaceae bacterium]
MSASELNARRTVVMLCASNSSIGSPFGVGARSQRKRPASVIVARRRFNARLKVSVSMRMTWAKDARSRGSMRTPPRKTRVRGLPAAAARAQSRSTCQSMRFGWRARTEFEGDDFHLRPGGDKLRPPHVVEFGAGVQMQRCGNSCGHQFGPRQGDPLHPVKIVRTGNIGEKAEVWGRHQSDSEITQRLHHLGACGELPPALDLEVAIDASGYDDRIVRDQETRGQLSAAVNMWLPGPHVEDLIKRNSDDMLRELSDATVSVTDERYVVRKRRGDYWRNSRRRFQIEPANFHHSLEEGQRFAATDRVTRLLVRAG